MPQLPRLLPAPQTRGRRDGAGRTRLLRKNPDERDKRAHHHNRLKSDRAHHPFENIGLHIGDLGFGRKIGDPGLGYAKFGLDFGDFCLELGFMNLHAESFHLRTKGFVAKPEQRRNLLNERLAAFRSQRLALEQTFRVDSFGKPKARHTVLIAAEEWPGEWALGA